MQVEHLLNWVCRIGLIGRGEVVAVLEYTCCRLDMEFFFVDKKFGAIRQLQFVWPATSRDLE